MTFRQATVCAVVLFMMQPLNAQDQTEADAPERASPRPAPAEQGPGRVNLEELVAEVSQSTGRMFLLERRTPRDVYVAGTLTAVPTYAELLAILRLNGLGAVEIDGIVNVVPMEGLRTLPTPIVQEDDADVPADAWVTRILTVGANRNVNQLVPVLRPLMPREAHLSSNGTGSLVIVDRYANVQRISALVEDLTD